MARFRTLRDALDPQEFVLVTGYLFRGFTITETPYQFNIILRATTLEGEGLYVMTQAPTPLDGLRKLVEGLNMGDGDKMWSKDKFFNGGAKN